MNLLTYFYEEFSTGLDLIDSCGPISITENISFNRTTLIFGGIAFFGTLLGSIYDDWSPYRGYMKGFLHKNWKPDYQLFTVADIYYPNHCMEWLDHVDHLERELRFTRFHVDFDYFHKNGLGNFVKIQDRFLGTDTSYCRDDPWWWDLLHMLLPFYRRYEWVGFRRIFVDFYYNFPFISYRLQYHLDDTDEFNPLPIPPWREGDKITYGVKRLYYDRETWRAILLLYHREYNSRSLIPSFLKQKSIYHYM